MLRILQNNKAQAVMGEYGLVFIIVIAMTTSMVIYFKRAVQGRVHDARNHMINTVFNRTAAYYENGLYIEYAPYYENVVSIVDRNVYKKTELSGGGTSGFFRKEIDETTVVISNSVIAPPKDAK